MSNIDFDALARQAHSVQTRLELSDFVTRLAQNIAQPSGEWSNTTLEEFLRALSSFIKDMPGYYSRFFKEVNPENASWRIFADILLAATKYE